MFLLTYLLRPIAREPTLQLIIHLGCARNEYQILSKTFAHHKNSVPSSEVMKAVLVNR